MDAPAAASPPRPRLSRLMTYRNFSIGDGHNVALFKGPRSFIETWTSEGDFDAARLIYGTGRGGERYGIEAAMLGAVPNSWEKRSLEAHEDLRESYHSVTFSKLAAQLPPQPDGPAVRFPSVAEVADGQNVWTPALALSDFIPVRSMPRSDGGTGRLLEIRTWLADGQMITGTYTAHKSGIDASDTASLTGRIAEKAFGTADLLSGLPYTDRRMVDVGTRGQGAVYSVQFMSLIEGATVQAVGDSICQGGGFEEVPHVSGHFSFAHIACAALSSPRLPVALLQAGIGGEPSLNFFQSATADLAYADVAIALIQTWSGNDIDHRSSPQASVAAADAAWGRAMHYGQLIRQQGGVPVYLSAVPQAPKMGSAGAEAARMSSVERCALLASRGEHVVDLNGVLGDASPKVSYKPGLGHHDNIHPNAAGNRAVSEALLPVLRGILGLEADQPS